MQELQNTWPSEAEQEQKENLYLATVLANPWIKDEPTTKQELFLKTEAREALFGGAAGGGKSYCLTMAALQYVDVPYYNALLVRRTYGHLSQPGALMDIMRQWLEGSGRGVHWDRVENLITFPSGAQLKFGYLRNEADKDQYQGANFHFIGVDELTQFDEDQYLWLMSRNRAPVSESDIPLRMWSASNPGRRGHCVPFGDVLTPNGWKDIKTLDRNEWVYTILDDGSLTSIRISQANSEWFEGDLINIESTGLSITCTPEHRIARVKNVKKNNSGFKLQRFDELPGQVTILQSATKWDGLPLEWFEVEQIETRKRRLKQPTTIRYSDYMSLLGWILSEGYTVDRDKAFGIAQSKPNHRRTVKDLLGRCGFAYSENDTGFTIYAPDWWNYIRQFGLCRDKFIPCHAKDCSKELLQKLFDALVDGDGNRISATAGRYYTTSKQLSDDFCDIALKLGYIIKTYERQRHNRKGISYAVNYKKNKNGGSEVLTGNHIYNVDTKTKRKTQINKIPFKGMVYCIGVPLTHNFIIRQNGSVWVSGNSWVKQRFLIEGELKGRTFVRSLLQDNWHLDYNEYKKTLENLDPVTRQQLLDGNWDVVAGGGFFQRQWFKILDTMPQSTLKVRFWDLAATPKTETNDPDWTAGALVSMNDGSYCVENIVRTQQTAQNVEQLIRQTADIDGPDVAVIIEQEPGASGLQVLDYYRRHVLPDRNLRAFRPTGPKESRIAIVSSHVESGNLMLLRGNWISDLLDEAELFPDGHDDQLDSIAGAVAMLQQAGGRTRVRWFGGANARR